MSQSASSIQSSIATSAAVIQSLASQVSRIEAIGQVVVGALRGGHKVLTAGHGGSAADALHMAEELMGRFKADRQPLPAVALVADPTLLTCIANDFGFAQLFPRQVEALGQAGDVLVIFSTSGQGEGLKLALEAAKAKGLTVVALLGKSGGALAGRADYELIVASDQTARIQEAHTLILHLVLEMVEAQFVV